MKKRIGKEFRREVGDVIHSTAIKKVYWNLYGKIWKKIFWKSYGLINKEINKIRNY